jgi:hypothetical protein
LTRRLESVPTLVIVTYRDDELTRDHPLRAVLGEFGARAIRVNVATLSPDAVASLASESGSTPTPSIVARTATRSSSPRPSPRVATEFPKRSVTRC